MKFVHIEDFFHPDAGYQVNLLTKLQVEQGHDVTIITSEFKKMPEYLSAFFGRENIEQRDQRFVERTGVKVIRIPLYAFVSGRSVYYLRIFKTIDNLKPDVLFMHGEDTLIGMQFIVRSLWQKFPMVLDCHMLEMASENRFREVFRFFFKHFITPIIIKKNIPLIRVVDSDYVQKCLGLPLEKTVLLSFGTDTNMFSPNKEASLNFRKKYNWTEDDFVVIYAGKLDEFKGGKFFANAIHGKFPEIKNRKIKFIVIGNAVGDYGVEVEKILSDSENEILRFTTQSYVDLVAFYQAADIAVFPKQCSLSFFEVQSCGLPVVLEENEINNQRVNFGNGVIFKAGDTEDFRDKIIKMIEMDSDAFKTMSQNSTKYVVDNYSYVPIAQKFTDVMLGAHKDFHIRKKSK